MTNYTCQKCGKIFDQKSHFAAHQNKKNPCDKNNAILNTLIEEKIKTVIVKIDDGEKPVTNKPRSIMADIIHNKEQRSAFYEGLHNLLWNEAGFDPAKALEHLTFFFAFRMIEDQVDTLELPQVCRWSYVVNLHDEHQIDKAVKDAILAFGRNETTKPFFKRHEIKKADLVQRIMVEINRLDIKSLQETDTLGDLFEYMIGRGMKTMADEGQYFTDRAICRLAFELCHEIKGTVLRTDGGICTFADFFCGTGGFVTEYVKGVTKVAREMGKSIDWSVAKDRVYAADKSESAAKTTLLNQLIITGQPFNSHNIREHNSFADPLVMGATAPFKDVEMDYLLLNPPYGGDKTKGKDYKFKYTRMVEEGGVKRKLFCVNPEIQSIGIEDDDKMSAGVQLAMATLAKDGGVCAIVLPQGFFFGATKKCVELRKRIAEEYKISHVVDISSGAFANTGTKTSMLVFQRGVGKTKTVKFIDVDKKELVTATLEDLQSKNYSLNFKQYISQDVAEIEGFQPTRLGDLVVITTGKNKTPDDKKGTKYPYYGTSGVTGYTDHFIEDGEYILTARNGTIGNTFMINGKSYPSDHMFILKSNEKCLIKYIYIWLNNNKTVMSNLANTTTIPGITKTSLENIQIPIPSLERQAEIVRAIDTWADFARREEELLKILEQQVMFEVREIGRGKPRVKLETIASDIIFGFMISSEDYGKHGIPVIKTKNIKLKRVLYPSEDQKIKTTLDNKYKVKRGDMLIVLGGSPGENGIWEFDEEAWLNQDCAKISIEDECTKMYVFYSLQGQEFNDYIESNTTKTTIGHISRGVVRGIEVPLPTPVEIVSLKSDFDEIRHKHVKIAEYKKKANDAIMRLIPGAAKSTTTPSSESSESEPSPASSPPTPAPTNVIVDNTSEDYKSKTLQQLKDIAREKGIKGFSTKKKDELITLLSK